MVRFEEAGGKQYEKIRIDPIDLPEWNQQEKHDMDPLQRRYRQDGDTGGSDRGHKVLQQT